jgi:hypothetical protein
MEAKSKGQIVLAISGALIIGCAARTKERAREQKPAAPE